MKDDSIFLNWIFVFGSLTLIIFLCSFYFFSERIEKEDENKFTIHDSTNETIRPYLALIHQPNIVILVVYGENNTIVFQAYNNGTIFVDPMNAHLAGGILANLSNGYYGQIDALCLDRIGRALNHAV